MARMIRKQKGILEESIYTDSHFRTVATSRKFGNSELLFDRKGKYIGQKRKGLFGEDVYYALAYCENLRSVNIPSTVTKIEDRVFERCKNLRRIDLSAGITAIEPFTFFLCEELRSVTIPEGVEKIGEGAFDSCFALKKIVIPKSVKEIGREAFRCCSGLLQVVLPEPLMPRASRLFRDSPKVKIVSI